MRIRDISIAALAAVLVTAAATRASAAAPWPHTFTSQGATVVAYQPQITDWKNYTVLDGLAAVQITTAGSTSPIYGVVTFEALTNANIQAGTVTLTRAHVTSTKFANEPADVAAKLDGIVRGISLQNNTIPLASVLASLNGEKVLPKPHRSPLRRRRFSTPMRTRSYSRSIATRFSRRSPAPIFRLR